MLRETSAGLSAPPDDAAAIRTLLTRAWEAWRSAAPLIQSDSASVRRYERPRLAEEYSRVMQEIEGAVPGSLPQVTKG
jgi:hypothetical protein